jgi:NTE family protein
MILRTGSAAPRPLRLLWLAPIVLLAGCVARGPVNPPLERWSPARPGILTSPERSPDLLLLVAFSGGGTRAAAFGYGVLEGLRDTTIDLGSGPRRLLDEVDVVSGVSGGSFVAADYGLHGDGIFAGFEERFLRRNVQGGLIGKLLNPINWVRLASPLFDRSDLATEFYDEKVFGGATFADLRKGPLVHVVINATDMVRGNRFSFVQPELDYLCADLAPIPIARAVAASAAFPGPLTPVILRSYAGTCGFEPPPWIAETLAARGPSRRRLRQAQLLGSYLDPERRHVYLLDGGIADNLGLRFSFERSIEQGGFVQMLEQGGLGGTREILFIVVNAETERELESREGRIEIGLATLLGTVSGIQIRSFNFETIELMRTSFASWAHELEREQGRAVRFGLVDLHFDAIQDPALRRELRTMPTTLALEDRQIDLLREAGRTLLRSSPEFQAALRRLAGREAPGPLDQRAGREATSAAPAPTLPP